MRDQHQQHSLHHDQYVSQRHTHDRDADFSRLQGFLHTVARHGPGPHGQSQGRGGRHGFGGDGGGIPRGRMVSSDDLQLLLLALLQAKTRHGYELIKALQTHSNGFYSPSPGMVYPALTHLEERGYVIAEQDGNRKRYSVSKSGGKFLTERRARADQRLERLKVIGSKMDSVRRAFSGESADQNTAAKSADETDGDGWHRNFAESRRALKHMLVQMIGAPVKRQRTVAAILNRALAEIGKLN